MNKRTNTAIFFVTLAGAVGLLAMGCELLVTFPASEIDAGPDGEPPPSKDSGADTGVEASPEAQPEDAETEGGAMDGATMEGGDATTDGGLDATTEAGDARTDAPRDATSEGGNS